MSVINDFHKVLSLIEGGICPGRNSENVRQPVCDCGSVTVKGSELIRVINGIKKQEKEG